MHRRINITLPDETVQLIDRVAKRGDRSFLIAEAVRHYVTSLGKKRLRRLIKEGAVARSSRDTSIAEDWGVPDDAWRGRRH